jgi:hypothetical protein
MSPSPALSYVRPPPKQPTLTGQWEIRSKGLLRHECARGIHRELDRTVIGSLRPEHIVMH